MDYTMAALSFLHLFGTYGLVGGVMFIRLISTPVMRRLEPEEPISGVLLIAATNRLLKFMWFYIFLSIATGIPLTLINSNFQGIGVLANDWSWAMHGKHILFVLFIVMVLVQTRTVVKIKTMQNEMGEKSAERIRLDRMMDSNALIILVLAVSIVLMTSATDTRDFNGTLTLLNFIHVILTAGWIGGLMFLGMVGGPIILGYLKSKRLSLIGVVHHIFLVSSRFLVILWSALILCIATGIPMMMANSQYSGLFSRGNLWSEILFAKHVVFAGMIVGAFVVTAVIRKIGVLLKAGHQEFSEEMKARINKSRYKMMGMCAFGFSLGMIVLILTALAAAVK